MFGIFLHITRYYKTFFDFIRLRNPQNAASGPECTQFAVMLFYGTGDKQNSLFRFPLDTLALLGK